MKRALAIALLLLLTTLSTPASLLSQGFAADREPAKDAPTKKSPPPYSGVEWSKAMAKEVAAADKLANDSEHQKQLRDEITKMDRQTLLGAQTTYDRTKFGKPRSAAEIRVLRELTLSNQQFFNKVTVLLTLGAKGGEAEKEALTGRQYAWSRARWAVAERDRKLAIEYYKIALKYAIRRVNTALASYEQTTTLENQLEALETRCQIELELLELSPEAVEQARDSKVN